MPSRSMLIALLALFVALGGPAEARKLINGRTIRAGTVASKQVKNRSLTTSDLASRTVTALRATPARSVGGAQLRDGAVSNAKLRTGSVTKGKIGSGDVGTEQLIDGDQRAADLGAFSGKVTGDFPALEPASCQSGDFPVTPTQAGGTLSGSLIVVGAPTALPDGLLVSGRPKDATTLRVQLCNLTAVPADPGALDFPYLAIAP